MYVPPRVSSSRAARVWVDKFLNNPTCFFEAMAAELPVGKTFGFLVIFQVTVLFFVVMERIRGAMGWFSAAWVVVIATLLVTLLVFLVGRSTSKKSRVGFLDSLWVWFAFLPGFFLDLVPALIGTGLYFVASFLLVVGLSRNLEAGKAFFKALTTFVLMIWVLAAVSTVISNGAGSGRWTLVSIDWAKENAAQDEKQDRDFREYGCRNFGQNCPPSSRELTIPPGVFPGIDAVKVQRYAAQYCAEKKIPSGLPIPPQLIAQAQQYLEQYCAGQKGIAAEGAPPSSDLIPGMTPAEAQKVVETYCKTGRFPEGYSGPGLEKARPALDQFCKTGTVPVAGPSLVTPTPRPTPVPVCPNGYWSKVVGRCVETR